MNISYNWLKDLIEIDLARELLAEKLTRVGLRSRVFIRMVTIMCLISI